MRAHVPQLPMLQGQDQRGVQADLQALMRGLENFRALLREALIIPLTGGVAGVSHAAGATAYLWHGYSVTEAEVAAPAPRRLVLGDLHVSVTPAPGAGETVTLTLSVDGLGTGLSVVIGESAISGVNLDDEVLVEPGDLLAMELVSSGGAATITHVTFSLAAGLHVL